MSKVTCLVTECDRKHHAKGYCSRHYDSLRRYGDPLAEVKRHYSSPEDAFLARTERAGECLLWRGSLTRLGYGLITVAGRLEMAHRFAWTRQYGPIPRGAEIDHTCWNRSCCNAEHLRLASHAENGRNRSGPLARNKTGHRNVRAVPSGFRVVVGSLTVGTFRSLDEAVAAAESEREVQFGAFAGRG